MALKTVPLIKVQLMSCPLIAVQAAGLLRELDISGNNLGRLHDFKDFFTALHENKSLTKLSMANSCIQGFAVDLITALKVRSHARML